MARRIVSSSSRKKQLEQDLKQGLVDLKNTRETLREAEERALEGYYPKWSAFRKIPAADYQRMMKLEKKFGLYNPTTSKLTTSRKRAIREHWQQLESLMKNAVFAEYPRSASPKTKETIKKQLRRSYPNARKPTKKGLWLPKSERQITAPIGQLKYDKDTGLYGIEVQKKTKKGYYAREFRYIADSNVLEIKQGKLQKHLDRKVKLGKNQRLRFIIGRNESRRVFRNMKELFDYASLYRRDDQARATFLNELLIEVVSKGPSRKRYMGRKNNRQLVSDPWTIRHSVFRADNYRETNADIISDMIEEMGEDDEE